MTKVQTIITTRQRQASRAVRPAPDAEVRTRDVKTSKEAEKLQASLSRITNLRSQATPRYGNGDVIGYRVKWWSVHPVFREQKADLNQADGIVRRFFKEDSAA